MPNTQHPYIAEDLAPLVVPITSVVGMDRNPRSHDGRSLDAIRASLAGFRQLKPVVLHADGRTVIAGNGTLKAALALGWSHIAVVRSGLDGERAKAYAVADNRATDLSSFDNDVLRETLRDLDRSLAEIAGFSDTEFAALFGPTEGVNAGDPVVAPDDPAARPRPNTPHVSVESAPPLSGDTTLVVAGSRDDIEYIRSRLEAFRRHYDVANFCEALCSILGEFSPSPRNGVTDARG